MDRIRSIFRNYLRQQKALKYRNYRLYVVGQGLSVVGTWMQRLAVMWLAYRLTNSAFLLGLIGFCEQIPILVLAPFAGVFADRWNKHRALIRVESLAILQALALSALVFTHLISVWHLVLLSLMLGFINAFEVPLRQSFVVEMVNGDKSTLPNAIAFNSMSFNMARLIGPSVAGIIISVAGEAWCFVGNGISYAAVTLSLILMHINHPEALKKAKAGGKVVMGELKEGFIYVSRHASIRSLLMVLAIVSFSRAAIRTLGPVFAKNQLHGDAKTFGWLMTAVGIGALFGALFLTVKRSVQTLNRIVSVTGMLLGIGLVGFAWSHWLSLSMFFLAICGLAQMMHSATTNTLLQLQTDDDKRGRVMSFYAVCLQGTTPLGSFVAGGIAGLIGAVKGVTILGSACFTGTFAFREVKVLGNKKKNQKTIQNESQNHR